MRTPPLRHPARRPPHRAAANAAQNDRQPPELQAHVAQSTRQQLAGPGAVRERRALLLSSSDTQRLVPRARRQLLLSRSGSAIDCPSFHLYGYDRDTLRRRPTTRRSTTVIRFDDAQRHDARRRHARHPPHPDDTHDRTFDVNAGWELSSRNPSIYSKDLKPVTDVKPTLLGDLRL